MAAAQVSATGEVTFRPQSHTFCGICDDHFMVCSCTGAGQEDYILKGLPSPPRDSTSATNLRRWASLVTMSMTMGRFAAQEWYRNEGAEVIAALSARSEMLQNMVEDYVRQLPTDANLASLALCAGGKPLGRRPATEQVAAVASEARAAVRTFLAGDWSCVTYLGIVLINNAFQTSDPNRYRLDDAALVTIFQKGVGCLMGVMDMGFSRQGYRLAMECDRPPQVPPPEIMSATDRDRLLKWCAANPDAQP